MHPDVVRAEAEVRVRRGRLRGDVRVFGRPLADAARLADDVGGRLRQTVVEVTGLEDAVVAVRPRILSVAQLKRYLP